MQVRQVMTENPVSVSFDDKVIDVAHIMRERDIGDVIVTKDGQLCGIVTDRDIVVRALGADHDVSNTRIGEICSQELVTASPDEEIEDAVQQMRAHAIRRLPVVENGRCVGVVSIGDLAVEREPRSALGEISAASPNR